MTEKGKKLTLKTASVLAFESKLANSDAIMTAGNWEDQEDQKKWQPIKVVEKSIRGTISNRLKSSDPKFKDPAKLDTEVTKANLQTVDNAALPFDTDTLKVIFTLRILGDLSTPSACDNPDYQEKLKMTIGQYIEQNGFGELALRYACNIANGRFLWRNRICAEAITIRVDIGDEVLSFNAYEMPLRHFSTQQEENADLKKLARVIEQGLSGDAFSFVTVDAFVKLGKGQMVYPSQEMVMGGGSGDKSKFLYQLDGFAAMHSQKIGNALRTIDTWHSEADEVGAIAVEPYGSVTNRGRAYRPVKNNDFYTLLDGWMIKDIEPAIEQQHYVMAVLIRGGVFGESGKE
jgi:CRISPR-associated protein Csy3